MLSPDRTGMVLQDRYRIVRKLGEGGMGEVYEVHHEQIGKRLAIKCLHPQFTRDPKAVERFTREAHTATKARNEHIVEVFDIGLLPDGCPYILMEYLEGRELADVIEQEGPLPIGRVVRIIEQVCEALTAVHAEDVVHRDLKPQNILLIRRKGNPDFVKVLDFGVSKVRQSADPLQGNLTRTGALIGTPHYMAPEQSKGLRNTDHRADIYALGVIMYLALIGRVPFDGETLPDLIMNIMTSSPVPPIDLRADIPREFNDIVLKAFHKDPNQRFSSAEELAQALAPFRTLDHQPTQADFSEGSYGIHRPIVPRTSERPISQAEEDFQSISYIRPASQAPSPPFLLRLESPRGWMLGTLGVIALLGVGAYVVWNPKTTSTENPPIHNGSGETQALLPATPIPHLPAPSLPDSRDTSANASKPAIPAPSTLSEKHLTKPTEETVREVHVRISVNPENATITLDGKEFPNPLDTYRPRSLEPVTIEVSHPGYQSQRRVALFDMDRNFTFELKPLPSRVRRTTSVRTEYESHSSKPALSKPAASTPLPTPPPPRRQLRTNF